ncbi:MAG: pyridoxal phosphate-dependent aminotransferase [Oscillospiraceae bacterium]|nr:pyridoxal phosphate-dependent aminotransferase [Oscillospiraceae bacterium]
MKYDFDKVVERKNTDSLKYDFAAEFGKPNDVLPLWVADMDFPAPTEVFARLEHISRHGIFGYSEPKGPYHDAVKHWFFSRFGFSFDKRDIVKTPGVVFALAMSVRAFTSLGDSVLIQTPVYYPFCDVISDNGRNIVKSPLVCQDGKYAINFADFEKKITDNNVKLFILCSPHNPVGRVWTREELTRIHAICSAHGVVVVADEIHCDFVYGQHKHTCYGTLDENAVIATSPSKTFNFAGLQIANIIVKDAHLRSKLKAEIRATGYSRLNTFGLAATESAYTYGGEWLEKLIEYLTGNINYLRRFLSENLPEIKLIEPEGTYLLWLDFSAYGLSQSELDHRVTDGAKLWLNGGEMFGKEGHGFQRINVACPRQTLEEALNRLQREFK